MRGEGSCDPGEEPGDIQLKISVQKHAVYTLKGSDLVCTLRVALSELLRGRLVSASWIVFYVDIIELCERCCLTSTSTEGRTH